jgi:hypothetical protein
MTGRPVPLKKWLEAFGKNFAANKSLKKDFPEASSSDFTYDLILKPSMSDGACETETEESR